MAQKGKVNHDAHECYGNHLAGIQQCIDENLFWVTVGSDGIAEFTNAVKTTDKWELVVKVYAKSGGRATIAEPVMMVEADG